MELIFCIDLLIDFKLLLVSVLVNVVWVVIIVFKYFWIVEFVFWIVLIIVVILLYFIDKVVCIFLCFWFIFILLDWYVL